MAYHVAIDIGASSGRVILARTANGLDLQEIHRFKNSFKLKDGHDRWNMDDLIENIFLGLEKVKQAGVEICTVGIDTWAVDYVLLDKNGNLLAQPVAYRDIRTQGAMEQVFRKIPKLDIYRKTGIQFLNFNTLYQLFVEDKDLLDRTDKILMIPDYIAFRLTGKIFGELTNWSTTQLLNLQTGSLDEELLDILDIPVGKFPQLIEGGQVIGELCHFDYDLPQATVIAVMTHDTASAVVGVPAENDNWAFLSSGTWSLIGVENEHPVTSQAAFDENYTNERGAYKTYRFLKNITGMWAVQEIARMLNYEYSFAEMAEQASKVEPFMQYVNLKDKRFTNPDNMVREIQAACRENHQRVPKSVGELVMCVYSNLALAYAHEWNVLEHLLGKKLEVLHIVGGGSNIKLLNQLTADIIGKPVIAGPAEATALGNIMVQMVTAGEWKNLAEARIWLAQNQPIEYFMPRPGRSGEHLEKYKKTVLKGE